MSHSESVSAPRIVRIELVPLFVPFNDTVKEVMKSGSGGLGMAIPAEEAWEGGEFVVCKLVAEDGHMGLGEAFVWLPETGVSQAQIIDSTEHALSRYLLTEDPFCVDRIVR